MSWTKQDREPYVESWHKRTSNLEIYMDNLVDVWHGLEDPYPSLYDFLGLEQEEIDSWIRYGTVPGRLYLLWLTNEY